MNGRPPFGQQVSWASVTWVFIGSGNGLLPVWHQAITYTNADLLSNRPLRTNFTEIWIKLQNFSWMKIHLQMPSAKWRPFCFNVLSPDIMGCVVSTPCPRQQSIHITDRKTKHIEYNILYQLILIYVFAHKPFYYSFLDFILNITTVQTKCIFISNHHHFNHAKLAKQNKWSTHPIMAMQCPEY